MAQTLPRVGLAPKAERALKRPPPASPTAASCQPAEPVRPGALHPALPTAGQEDCLPEEGRPLRAGTVHHQRPGPRHPQHPLARWISGRQVGTPRARPQRKPVRLLVRGPGPNPRGTQPSRRRVQTLLLQRAEGKGQEREGTDLWARRVVPKPADSHISVPRTPWCYLPVSGRGFNSQVLCLSLIPLS